MAFSDPPSPPTSDYVIYEWSPNSAKFPDKKSGSVYVAGWGLRHESTKEDDCTTGKKGPDPFSKCKFPFFSHKSGLGIPFNQCLHAKPPSAFIKECEELLKLKQIKNKTATMLDKDFGIPFGRVSTSIFLIGIVSRVQNLSFLFKRESCCLYTANVYRDLQGL